MKRFRTLVFQRSFIVAGDGLLEATIFDSLLDSHQLE